MIVKETKQIKNSNKVLQQEIQDEVLTAISLYKEAFDKVVSINGLKVEKMIKTVQELEEARKYLFSFVKAEY